MPATGRPAAGRFELVVLVASAGGVEALGSVLTGLPPAFPTPVLVVQHGLRRPVGQQVLASVLAYRSGLHVRYADDGQSVTRPGVTVVPTGMTGRADQGRLHLVDDEDRRPADALLRSLGPAVGRAMIAVVLTGHGEDGSVGARVVKRHGGRVIVQDPSTARAASMPTAALATGCVDFAVPLERIPAAIVALTMAPGGAEMLAVPTPSWARLLA